MALGRVLAVVGVAAATLAATGCGGYDRDAYCAAVRNVRQPAALPGDSPSPATVGPANPADPSPEDDAALRRYLGQVRRLEELAPQQDQGQWRTLREGLESVMTDGRLDVAKVEKAQKELTLMAQAADRLDTSLVGECGAGLSPG